MWFVPPGRLDVTNVAVPDPSAPPTTGASPMCTFPFRNETVPTSICTEATGVVTTAVNVTGWPSVEGFGEDVRAR